MINPLPNPSRSAARGSRQIGAASRSFLFIVILALAGGLGFWFSQRHFAGDVETRIDASRLQAVSLFPSPLPLDPFELRTVGDATITPADFAGRWTLVFFGFTHCPDICPTTLARLAEAAKLWDQSLTAEQRPVVVLVSVDPERDSPQHTAEYAAYFDKGFIGATNGHEFLQPMARNMGMVYAAEPLDSGIEGDYEVQHSSRVVLIDPQGRRAGLISQPLDPAAIAADMTYLAGGKGGR
ncbi:MAG: SCO family protein [Lysobacteraceae bacterium]